AAAVDEWPWWRETTLLYDGRVGVGYLASFYRSVVSKKTFNTLGRLPVEAHLQVGLPQPPEQAEVLGHQTVLRPVQPVQAQHVGVRRRRQRRLRTPVGLDTDRPTPQGHRRCVC